MLDKTLRQSKDAGLKPLVHLLGDTRPEVITYSALAVGLSAAIVAWQGWYWLALALWLINRVLDGLDGSLARARGTQTDWGGYLDLIVDYLIYALIPIAIMFSDPSQAKFLVLAFLLGSFYVNSVSWTVLSTLLERQGRARGQTAVIMPAGLIEGTETIIFYSLFLIFPQFVTVLFTLMAILVSITIVQRLLWARTILA